MNVPKRFEEPGGSAIKQAVAVVDARSCKGVNESFSRLRRKGRAETGDVPEVIGWILDCLCCTQLRKC